VIFKVAAGLSRSVDRVIEDHRTQFGSRHGLMRGALPTACFIGFTGTPVRKRDKSTVERFGGLILPIYSIHRAVEDASVVPLVYEGRHIAESVRSDAIDEWFDRVRIVTSCGQLEGDSFYIQSAHNSDWSHHDGDCYHGLTLVETPRSSK
jgi:hypothetical protein